MTNGRYSSSNQVLENQILEAIHNNNVTEIGQWLQFLKNAPQDQDLIAEYGLDEALQLALQLGNPIIIGQFFGFIHLRYHGQKQAELQFIPTILAAIAKQPLLRAIIIKIAAQYNQYDLLNALINDEMLVKNTITELLLSLNDPNNSQSNQIQATFITILKNSATYPRVYEILVQNLNNANPKGITAICKLITAAQLDPRQQLELAIKFAQPQLLQALPVKDDRVILAALEIMTAPLGGSTHNSVTDQIITQILYPFYADSQDTKSTTLDKLSRRLKLLAVLVRFCPALMPSSITINLDNIIGTSNAKLILTIAHNHVAKVQYFDDNNHAGALQTVATNIQELFGANILVLTNQQQAQLPTTIAAKNQSISHVTKTALKFDDIVRLQLPPELMIDFFEHLGGSHAQQIQFFVDHVFAMLEQGKLTTKMVNFIITAILPQPLFQHELKQANQHPKATWYEFDTAMNFMALIHALTQQFKLSADIMRQLPDQGEIYLDSKAQDSIFKNTKHAKLVLPLKTATNIIEYHDQANQDLPATLQYLHQMPQTSVIIKSKKHIIDQNDLANQQASLIRRLLKDIPITEKKLKPILLDIALMTHLDTANKQQTFVVPLVYQKEQPTELTITITNDNKIVVTYADFELPAAITALIKDCCKNLQVEIITKPLQQQYDPQKLAADYQQQIQQQTATLISDTAALRVLLQTIALMTRLTTGMAPGDAIPIDLDDQLTGHANAQAILVIEKAADGAITAKYLDDNDNPMPANIAALITAEFGEAALPKTSNLPMLR